MFSLVFSHTSAITSTRAFSAKEPSSFAYHSLETYSRAIVLFSILLSGMLRNAGEIPRSSSPLRACSI
ncbi:MAG TPA: hypothetical protein VHA09_07425 [Nitrososphaera sp.]|nr:hypothetical protein [Nitrososphaera sp.]